MKPKSNAVVDIALKLLAEERCSLPIAHTVAMRMGEILAQGMREDTEVTYLRLPLSHDLVDRIDRIGKYCGVPRLAAIRGLLMLATLLYDVVMEDDKAEAARYHLERALELADYIAPADKQYARERLLTPNRRDPENGVPNHRKPEDHMPRQAK
jgi:hypothetical protein